MATLDDLSAGIVTTLAGILFPGQPYLPGAIADIVSPWQGQPGAEDVTIPARVYRGYPTTKWENDELSSGRVGISVNNVKGMNRTTTRFQPFTTQASANAPTLLVAWSQNSVTFGGECSAGQVAGITAGNICYAYRLLSTDTPATVAAAFAAKIPNATAAGALLSAAGVTSAAVVCDQTTLLHTGQHEQMIEISCIVPNVSEYGGGLARAAAARAISGLKAMLRPDGTLNHFIGLADGSSALIRFHHEVSDDTPRNQNAWRYWAYFLCEYDETIAQVQPSVLSANILLQSGGDVLSWVTPAIPATDILTDGNGNILTDGAGNILGTVL